MDATRRAFDAHYGPGGHSCPCCGGGTRAGRGGRRRARALSIRYARAVRRTTRHTLRTGTLD